MRRNRQKRGFPGICSNVRRAAVNRYAPWISSSPHFPQVREICCVKAALQELYWYGREGEDAYATTHPNALRQPSAPQNQPSNDSPVKLVRPLASRRSTTAMRARCANLTRISTVATMRAYTANGALISCVPSTRGVTISFARGPLCCVCMQCWFPMSDEVYNNDDPLSPYLRSKHHFSFSVLLNSLRADSRKSATREFGDVLVV
jgi:hypothetical protein